MNISRREFIEGLVGSASLGSIMLSGACTPDTTTSSIITSPVTSNSAPTTTQVPSNSQTTASNIDLHYIPPSELPEMKQPPGCTSWVAMDRMYTVEHVWVKSLEGGRAVMGITDKLQMLMSRITSLQLSKEGEMITRAEPFGYAEGDKMSVDIIAPVSGRVVELNNNIWAGGGDNDGLDLITGSPYMNGWMVVVDLSKPAEMSELITPETYMALNAKLAT